MHAVQTVDYARSSPLGIKSAPALSVAASIIAAGLTYATFMLVVSEFPPLLLNSIGAVQSGGVFTRQLQYFGPHSAEECKAWTRGVIDNDYFNCVRGYDIIE